MNFEKIIDKIVSNQRVDSKEAITLFHEADLLILGDIANKIRLMLHPEPFVTFVVDRNINYTNVCVSGCLFCAFFRSPEHEDAYVISKESLKKKIEENVVGVNFRLPKQEMVRLIQNAGYKAVQRDCFYNKI